MPIDMLIGSDHYWEVVTSNVRRGKKGPTAIYTKFGWVLSGPTDTPTQEPSSVNVVTSHILRIDTQLTAEEELDSTLKKFWELESLGIGDHDISVLEDFSNKITFNDGRYQVSLPWKETHPALPDNYFLSLKRLCGLLHRLKQCPSLLEEYDALIKDQLRKGIIEVVRETEARPIGEVHYIPHHAVTRQDKKTTKLRVVYDASARGDGPSLNDCLYAGPKFEQSIMDIILRFRTYKVALIADIEKAFLQISVTERDRDALRFLWVEDVAKEDPGIITLRFTRVPFGVMSSPFLLNATVQHHLSQYATVYPETVQKISQSMYVDDLAFGADSNDPAYELYTNSKAILREGGFNLRKFMTNSSTLQEQIERNESQQQVNQHPDSGRDESYTQSTLGTTQLVSPGETKVLGVKWNPTVDSLVFDLSDIAATALNLEPTKRSVVGVASRFYDPIGFISPVTIRFKMLFQDLCRERLDWDELLPRELLSKWQALVSNLQQTQSINIPRCYFDSPQLVLSCSLQGFCDASKSAYAAVVYLTIDTGHVREARFVACKTRVSPLKEQTIPRLELLSALLLSKLMTSISQALEPELSLTQPSYFTDSEVALYWIKKQEKEWKPFVQNRVNQIRTLTSVDHCAGTDNPADIPSRGADPSQLSSSALWLHGPDWLRENHILPDHDDKLNMPEACGAEQKRPKDTLSLLTPLSQANQVKIGVLIEPTNFSSKERLLRLTACVLKCIHVWKRKTKKVDADPAHTISLADLQEAENCWVREMQDSLGRDARFPTWQQQFGLFPDDRGIWRCGGRLARAELPFTTRHPVLLDQRHHLTTLIVRDSHARVKHGGVKETLTELRSGYWIIRGRNFVRKILHQCVMCRRFEGKPYKPPPPPPLPSFRVNQAPAFTYTGVDYAGPLYVKGTDHLEGDKIWICLYTCCVVRAIHLEVVPDLTTQSFIRSFKRFTARRGFPVKIISDNAKTFKSASKVLSRILKHPELEEYLAGVHIQWTFNLEKAPWWGGIFERMVKSVKRCLRKTVGRGKLTLDELTTAVTEVEMIVNSRPLTYVSTEDIEEPITPSHLIAGRRLMSLPDGPYNRDIDDDSVVEHSTLTKRMIHLNILDHFWKRWKREYLLELREAHRQVPSNATAKTISVGDIVVVQDTDRPRGFWKLARVESLITGSDGRVRGASVRLHSSAKRHTHLQRPIQLLYPLEVHSAAKTRDPDSPEATPSTSSKAQSAEQGEANSEMTKEGNSATTSSTLLRQRPKRLAAQNAREIVRVLAEDDS